MFYDIIDFIDLLNCTRFIEIKLNQINNEYNREPVSKPTQSKEFI